MTQSDLGHGDTSWFVEARFGLFIHWGFYALLARNEWIKQIEEIPDERYDQYAKYFDPDLYDPDQWARAAVDAGMKYFVITTKHHDGFCLWDSKLTDYKATNTPAGRDLIRPMVEAFRRHGLRVGFYHSLLDWHHPHFTIDDTHPMRNHPDRQEMNKGRDLTRYAEYLHGQVRELLTEYGKIDLMFYDFSYEKGRDVWQSEKLLKMTRELQPGIVVNDRLDLVEVEGGWDYRCAEQFQPREGIAVGGKPVPWESCQTFSGSWGYHRDEASWKSVEQLVRMLVDTVSKGGNLIMNVGPTARGEFDDRALDRLNGMGEWMTRHGRSIYGCTQAPAEFQVPDDCRLTYNPRTRCLYVHLFAWPYKYLNLDGYAGRVQYAQLLNDASEVKMLERIPEAGYGAHEEARGATQLTLELPVVKPNITVPVIELFLR